MKTKLLTVICLALSFAASITNASASAGKTAVKVADVVIVRPISLVSIAVGSAFFAISLPITALTKSVKPAADILVVKPAHATFKRPIGDMEALGD